MHVVTRQQCFAAVGPSPRGKVQFEVNSHLGRDHTSTMKAAGNNPILTDGTENTCLLKSKRER